jgi:uncharacterized protein
MYFSRFNIFSKIRDSENYYILNLLSGNADILTPEKAKEIIDETYTDIDEYIEKGYLIDRDKEERIYNQKYYDFIEQRESSEIQLFFVPNYDCNFSCTYCYQQSYINDSRPLDMEVVDAFYRYLDTEMHGKRKYITVFGGEPLLPGKGKKESISYILNEASARDIDVAVVTNGYHLKEYVPFLEKANIREIQVTLDGTADIHDTRRRLKNGGGTFNAIVEGIDAALEKDFPINLRVVIDGENLKSLPELAVFAVKKGWTGNLKFKTQLGRNYELHGCHSGNSKLYSRLEFFEEIYKLVPEHPEIIEFHEPSMSLSRFLFKNGELPDPLFDSCPACKTEWAFDYTGRIYSCTATVGKIEEALGTFYPEVKIDRDRIDTWRKRDVRSIPECKGCALQLTCGGGCGMVAKNRNGKILSGDCKPEEETIAMGISLYFNKGVLDVGQNNVHKCCSV